jgi:peptidoglycan endopeptidase LytF
MSRRDTIIVAVLVNAGLLIVLFASALKSDSSAGDIASVSTPVIQESTEIAMKKEATPVVGDEVDLALSQFQNAVAAAPAPQPAPSMPMTPPTNSFADDLKAISIPEQQPVAAAPAPSAPATQTLTTPIPQANKPAPEFFEVKVKKGDVLEKIARHHHSTVAEIMKANKLTSSNLRIGQVLKVPNKSIKKAEPTPVAYSPAAPAAGQETGAKYYTVKKGDNPWTIAVKNRLKVEDLLKLNSMTEEQARRLKPGDQLRIQ